MLGIYDGGKVGLAEAGSFVGKFVGISDGYRVGFCVLGVFVGRKEG